MSLLSELKRRNVFKVAAAYVIVGWLLVQVADVFFPALQLPGWTVTFVAALLILGFPVALLLSWAYELTPEGVKRTRSVPLSESISKVTGRKLDFVIIALLGLAVVILVVDNYVLEDSGEAAELVADQVGDAPSQTAVRDLRTIAVLPFDNRSAQADDEFFVAGIHDDILSQLARIATLKVISRTSVMGYRDTDKNIPTIGEELGVATILEGGVQRAGDTVRINVQLIDAETDQHLWAENYDRELTAENIFAIQSEIAMAIADALQAALSPREVARLNTVPTLNTRAYDFYLSGNDYFHRPADIDFVGLAVQQYERAVEEDAEFALAWASLSRAHTLMHWFALDRTDARLALAREAVERAFSLEPGLPEAHVAMAQFYFQGLADYDAALREIAIAEQDMPGNADIYQMRAYIYRRIADFEQALADFDRAIELDPRSVDLLVQQARTYVAIRRYEAAGLNVERVLDIQPDDLFAEFLTLFIPLVRDGDVNPILAASGDIRNVWADTFTWVAALYQRDYDAALRYLEGLEKDALGSGRDFYIPRTLASGATHAMAGDEARAETDLRSALVQTDDAIATNPEDPRFHAARGQILAYLGEREAASAAARRAIEFQPTSVDAMSGPVHRLNAFITFVRVGAHDEALEELEAYLSGPGDWSIEGLLPDPRLDPIRDDPRFQALVDKYRRR